MIIIYRVTDAGQQIRYHEAATLADAEAHLVSLTLDDGKQEPAELIFEIDEDHPDCADAMVCWMTHADQYSIQPSNFGG